MKTNSWLASALALISLCARGQIPLPSPASVPVLMESGLHHRIWRTVSIDEEGRTNVSAFTEVATGLNFLDPATGQFLPSQELFQIAADGSALAAQGQHRLRLDSDINSGGSVDLVMPDGQRLICNPMGLSFFDYSSGKNILLAEVTNCIGELVAPNVVVYQSAFDTLKAALRYTYTKDGFEQDVILYENPGSPADYGLNPDTTLLEMYSEFHNSPAPTVQSSSDRDQTLNFGQMQMIHGQAYFLDDASGAADVNKTWANIDGRTFLVESVPYPAVRSMLEKMALAQGQASNRSSQDRKGLVAGLRPRERAIRVASIKPGKFKSNAGFLIDFVTKNSNLTNFTWQGDTTYYISGNVGLYGTNTVFESGAVLKYTNNVSLTVNTPLTWRGSAYRPVVLTARDDASVGDSITPTNALSGYYATVALALDGNAANTNFVLQNLRVANAQTAIAINGKSGHTISHAQLVGCKNGFSATNADFSLRNALFDRVLTNFTGSSSTGRVEHLTVNTATWLNKDIGTNLFLTNCLLVAVTNSGSYSGNTVSNVASSSGVFQAVGAGFLYLANNNYRNLGTTNINGFLLSDLKKKTTYPPLVLTNTYNYSVTLGPQAQRDTDTPDLGFHYDPIDYAINTLTMTNAALILTNGVALATFGNNGIWLREGSQLFSEGAPLAHNHLTRYYNVQEQPTNWGGGVVSSTTTVNPYNYGGSLPSAQLRFTDFDGMAGGGNHLSTYTTNWTFSSLSLWDCSFNSATLYLDGPAASILGANNNLFERVAIACQGPPQINFYNNLLRYGTILSWNTGTNNWLFKDNAFDNSPVTHIGSGVTAANNAYINVGADRFSPTNANDKVLTAFTYTNSTLGSFYQVSTNLYDMGSRNATNAGLYHYTVKSSQVKETNSVVDIGFHYVSTDANGNPLDYDIDGFHDYFEDRNGNGVIDTGETNWQDPNDLGLKVWITEPKNNSNIP